MKKILILEGNSEVRNLMAEMLQMDHLLWDIETTGSVSDAVARLKNPKPKYDLIIFEFESFPDEKAAAFSAAVRCVNSKCKVVVTSMHMPHIQGLIQKVCSPNGCIGKPFNGLVELVNELLEPAAGHSVMN